MMCRITVLFVLIVSYAWCRISAAAALRLLGGFRQSPQIKTSLATLVVCTGALLLWATPVLAASPSVPTNLTATAVTPSWANLSWTASTASGANTVVGYNVYRNGVLIPPWSLSFWKSTHPKGYYKTVPTTVPNQLILYPWKPTTTVLYSDPYLTPGASYTYTVAAVDSAGGISAQSAPATVTMPPAIATPHAAYIRPFYTCVTNYYVSAIAGNDTTGNGSRGNPWKTISKAVSFLRAQGGVHGGVCVNVEPGTYIESVIADNLSGSSDTPSGYLVFRSTVPHAAIIRTPPNAPDYTWGISLQGTNKYIVIDGFTIDGTPLGTHPTYINGGNIDAQGIVINGSTTLTCSSHHIKILNNIIHGWGGSGIGTGNADYVDVEGNVVYGCAYLSQWGESGIDFVVPVALDSGKWSTKTVDSASAKYHYIVRGNIAYYNAEVDIDWAPHWDGHGITFDTFHHPISDSTPRPPNGYQQPTLVDNNLCFGNGGAGIATGGSGASYLTIRNNTCFDNFLDNQSPSINRGEIWLVTAGGPQPDINCVIANNIAVANPAANPNNVAFVDAGSSSTVKNSGNVWKNNLSFNGAAGQPSTRFLNTTDTITAVDGNILGSNPLFVKPIAGNFTLQPTSPAINAGTNACGLSALDLEGNPRISKGVVDMGAYEFMSGTLGSHSNTRYRRPTVPRASKPRRPNAANQRR